MSISMSPHGTSLFACILQKVHVHRILMYDQVSVAVSSLYTSYALPKDTHMHIQPSDMQNICYLLCLKGYSVRLLNDLDIRSEPTHNTPFCAILWNSEMEHEKQEGDEQYYTQYAALGPLEQRCFVNIPSTKI